MQFFPISAKRKFSTATNYAPSVCNIKNNNTNQSCSCNLYFMNIDDQIFLASPANCKQLEYIEFECLKI